MPPRQEKKKVKQEKIQRQCSEINSLIQHLITSGKDNTCPALQSSFAKIFFATFHKVSEP